MDIKNTKIAIKNPEHSILVQKALFELGVEWWMLDSNSPQHIEKKYLFVDAQNSLSWLDDADADYFSEHSNLEIVYNLETSEFETPKTLKHKHADLIMKFAEIAQTDPEPWQHFEYFNTLLRQWIRMGQHDSMFRPDYEYRFKKVNKVRKMNIKGVAAPKLVFGVGINDSNYVVQRKETIIINGKRKQKLIWICPYYLTWKNMLQRCYSTKYQNKKPTYIGCTVSDEWKTFSNFKDWMMTQDFIDKHLDKDLLVEGNRVYGDKTCVFISGAVNMFTTDRGNDRGGFLIGVCWDKGKSKFRSSCSNPFTKKIEHLGYFDCEQEAHEAWLKRKLELAHELASEQPDERVAESLINRYSNYKNTLNKSYSL